MSTRDWTPQMKELLLSEVALGDAACALLAEGFTGDEETPATRQYVEASRRFECSLIAHREAADKVSKES